MLLFSMNYNCEVKEAKRCVRKYENTKIIEVANMSKMKWSGLNC